MITIETTVSHAASRTPCQTRSTSKPPSMIQATSQTNRPFRKRAPRPSVHAVIGSAKRISAGQISELSTPSNADASSAYQKLSSVTPGTNAAPIMRPIAFSTHITRIRTAMRAFPWGSWRRWMGFAFPLTRA